MATQASYGIITNMIRANESIDRIRLAAKHLGVRQSTIDVIFDILSPLSEFRKQQNNAVMNVQIRLAAEEQQQFIILMQQNAKLRLVEAELLEDAKNQPRKIMADYADEPARKGDTEQEKSLVARLAEQNEKIDFLSSKIKAIDREIIDKQHAIVDVLLSRKAEQSEKIDNMYDALQKTFEQKKQMKLNDIALDDPDRAAKLATIEAEYDAIIAAYRTQQQEAVARRINAVEKTTMLMTAPAVKLSQGKSLNLAVLTLTLDEQPDRLEVMAKRAEAKAQIAAYRANFTDTAELEGLKENYKTLAGKYALLEQEIKEATGITDKKEITDEQAAQFTPELQAKYDELRLLENQRDGARIEFAKLRNYFADKDKPTIERMVENAEAYLKTTEDYIGQQTLGESVKASEIKAEESIRDANPISKDISNLQDKKSELTQQLQSEIEQNAETVLNLSSLKAEQAKAPQQNLSATAEQPALKQENNLQPGRR